jgi:hypothetical protein
MRPTHKKRRQGERSHHNKEEDKSQEKRREEKAMQDKTRQDHPKVRQDRMRQDTDKTRPALLLSVLGIFKTCSRASFNDWLRKVKEDVRELEKGMHSSEVESEPSSEKAQRNGVATTSGISSIFCLG